MTGIPVRLRRLGRTGLIMSALLMVLTGLLLAGPMAPSAHAATKSDPCQFVTGPLKKACQAQSSKPTAKPTTDPCASIPEPARSVCKSAPAPSASADPCKKLSGPAIKFCEGGSSGGLDDVTGDCKSPPSLEVPGDGILGSVDPGPSKVPIPRDPTAKNAQAYIYQQYGYAGLTWNTYDLGCGGAVRDPSSSASTWLADTIFTWSKWWTALCTGLNAQVTSPHFLKPIDPMLTAAAHGVRDAVYTPWIGVSLLLLGATLVFAARKKDLPRAAANVGWAVLVMTAATVCLSYPVTAAHVADSAIYQTVGQINQKIADSPIGGAPADKGVTDPATAQGDMLVSSVLYSGWLQGEFGSATSATARTYGMQLYDAQALTWAESRLPATERSQVVTAKQKRWQQIAATIYDKDPTAYRHLTGQSSGRLGAAVNTAFAALSANSYSIIANLVIAASSIVIALLVIFLPAAAVVGIHERTSGVVKKGFEAGLAAVINAPIFALCAAIDVLMVRALLASRSGMSEWTAVVVLLVVTAVLWTISKPFRRLTALVSPDRAWADEAYTAMGAPARAAKSIGAQYLKTRYLRRALGQRRKAAPGRGSGPAPALPLPGSGDGVGPDPNSSFELAGPGGEDWGPGGWWQTHLDGAGDSGDRGWDPSLGGTGGAAAAAGSADRWWETPSGTSGSAAGGAGPGTVPRDAGTAGAGTMPGDAGTVPGPEGRSEVVPLFVPGSPAGTTPWDGRRDDGIWDAVPPIEDAPLPPVGGPRTAMALPWEQFADAPPGSPPPARSPAPPPPDPAGGPSAVPRDGADLSRRDEDRPGDEGSPR